VAVKVTRAARGQQRGLAALGVRGGEGEMESGMALDERAEFSSGIARRTENPDWNLMHN
jgi:hypothetical protein